MVMFVYQRLMAYSKIANSFGASMAFPWIPSWHLEGSQPKFWHPGSELMAMMVPLGDTLGRYGITLESHRNTQNPWENHRNMEVYPQVMTYIANWNITTL